MCPSYAQLAFIPACFLHPVTQLSRWHPLLGLAKQFLPHRQAIRGSVVVNLLEFLASPQLVKMLIEQEQAIPMLARDHAMMGNPVHQLASNGLYLSIGIGFLL
jgi:hypothetical protein